MFQHKTNEELETKKKKFEKKKIKWEMATYGPLTIVANCQLCTTAFIMQYLRKW